MGLAVPDVTVNGTTTGTLWAALRLTPMRAFWLSTTLAVADVTLTVPVSMVTVVDPSPVATATAPVGSERVTVKVSALSSVESSMMGMLIDADEELAEIVTESVCGTV